MGHVQVSLINTRNKEQMFPVVGSEFRFMGQWQRVFEVVVPVSIPISTV